MALKKLKKLYGTSSNTSSSNSLTNQVSNLKTRLEASGVSTDSRSALQKTLNLREGSGFLEGLGDVLERASGLASIKAMIANKNENLSLLEKAWQGFTGDLRYTGADVLTSINPDFNSAGTVGKFLGGMAVDILLDPATYLTFGASALAKGATTAGVKALGAVDDVADVAKVLKATKTADQATDIIKGTKAIKGFKKADRASELLKAGKAYRTADTLDTIANPLKLVPMGVKKAGGLAMQGVEKVNPRIAEGMKRLGNEFKKTFNFSKHLKDNIGEEAYKQMKAAESVSEATMAAVSKSSGEQYKLFQKALKGIKQDPDRVWTLTSKVDGSKSTFTFAGMSDDDILKKLYEFANNEVYFNRPTVVNADTVTDLARNGGRSMIAAQDFADPRDLKAFEKSLKAIAKDPDQVSISRYIQPETGKPMGWVIDIGEKNAEYMTKQIDNINKNFDIKYELVGRRVTEKQAVMAKRKNLENTIVTNKQKITELEDMAKQLSDNYARRSELTQEQFKLLKNSRNKKVTKATKEKLTAIRKEIKEIDLFEKEHGITTKKELLKAKRTANVLQRNLRVMDETSVASADELLKLAKKDARKARAQKNLVEDAFKTRELIPFESPIIDVPEMKDIAKLQKEITDTNLGLRNLGGFDVENMDKYEYYIHRKLTPESQAYIKRHNLKKDPTRSFLIGSTDKLPAQAAMSNLYGNFSPAEANTMMGFDLFDNNIVSANLDMVTKLNRRTYNSKLTKALFTEPNNWVKNVDDLTDLEIDDLIQQGYEPVSSLQVASKLRLSEILNESDIRKITEQLKDKSFLMHTDVADMFDKNIKLYKQLDSEFYQQLNKYMKYWKGGNLLSVGYHLRNMFGAQTNMALAGMGLDDVARYSSQAGLDVAKYNSKLLPEFRKWVLEPQNAEIFKTGTLDDVAAAFSKQVGEKDARLFTEMLDAQIKGVWGGIVGQHDAVKRAVGEMPTSKLGRVADKVHDINYKLGATTDDINRLASYRWAQDPKNYAKIAKVGAQDAVDFVNYAMFDFKSMSPTEQAYFTKIFPFYNFIKNNLVFQTNNILTNTQRYGTLSKAYKNLYSSQEITDDEIQQYVKDQLYIPIKQKDGTIKVLKISAPVQDATNLLQLKNILGASNPLIQYITDRAYGEDLYTGAELTGDRTKNTQEFVDILPYGRTVRTLTTDPLSVLFPISTTTSDKGRNQNAYAELERLERLRKQYKKETGQSLPTLEDLGLR